MVIAQALGEYGVLSGIVSAFSEAWTHAHYFISNIEPGTWAIAGICVFVVAYLWNRAK